MRLSGAVVLLAMSAAMLCAQHSNGYLFGGVGGVSSGGGATVHLGIGGEAVLAKGIGVGGEIGALGPAESFSNAVAVLSANGYYHFSRARLDPFVTAGYSRLQRQGGLNAFNFGGGANYWFFRHLGVRIEFRDHVTWQGGAYQFYGIRFGLAF